MTTTDDATPEALLKRAMDALTVAETKAQNRPLAWAEIARAAAEAGQLAALCRDRVVVVDGLSDRWKADLEKAGMVEVTNPPRTGKSPESSIELADPEGGNYWLSHDEWDTILALRVGQAVVMPAQGSAKAPESPAEGRTGARRGRVRPRDLDQSDVDADGDRAQEFAWRDEVIQQQRQFIVALMGKLDVVSIRLTAEELAHADREVSVHDSPSDGKVLRVVGELTQPA